METSVTKSISDAFSHFVDSGVKGTSSIADTITDSIKDIGEAFQVQLSTKEAPVVGEKKA